ncbi:MAG: hemerythrin domain-containing protein, partial [Pseudomonadota bacterium]
TREGLPSDMQILLRDLPRDRWQAHPNFRRPTEQWMGAHQGFRQLGAIVQEDVEDFLAKDIEDQYLARRLGWFGGLLVRNLHGHHTWEDGQFFPELEAADARFARGLEMLETDHEELDALIDTLTRQANRVIQLETLDPAQMPEEAKPLRDTCAQLNRFLARHLTDEEDLVVPIILHHKLRG